MLTMLFERRTPFNLIVNSLAVNSFLNKVFNYTELQINKNRVQVERSFGKETDLAIEFDKTRLTKTISSLAFLTKSLT